jgi:hypothetical protein
MQRQETVRGRLSGRASWFDLITPEESAEARGA